MKFRKTAAATVVGLGVATVGFASASLLNLDGSTIQHGTSGVSAQASTVQTNWGYESDDNSVHYVRFSDFDEAAEGEKAFVKVFDNNGGLIAKDSFTVTRTNADRINLPITTHAVNIGSVEVTLAG